MPRSRFAIRAFAIVILTVAAVSVETAVGQKAQKVEVVWTKIIIPTLSQGCRIELASTSLSPSVSECVYAGHLRSGSQVAIVSRTKTPGWTLLKLRSAAGVEFDFYVEHRSQVSFERLLNSVFSAKKVEFEQPGCNFRTVKEAIQKVGFPTKISREKGKEKWVFDADYLASSFCSYDVTFVDFENGKVKQVSGLI
jgi:hypothetical protein